MKQQVDEMALILNSKLAKLQVDKSASLKFQIEKLAN
jgi:hypothetical protein